MLPLTSMVGNAALFVAPRSAHERRGARRERATGLRRAHHFVAHASRTRYRNSQNKGSKAKQRLRATRKWAPLALADTFVDAKTWVSQTAHPGSSRSRDLLWGLGSPWAGLFGKTRSSV